jgi:imidazolonepropionase-like amidohydrolase
MHALFERTRSLTTALAASFLLVGAFLSSALTQQSERALVFRDVDVFDGSRMIRHTTVLVRDGMVRAIGQDIAIPSLAEVIDGKGKTLLPGLIDAHVHLGVLQGEQFLNNALNFGIRGLAPEA